MLLLWSFIYSSSAHLSAHCVSPLHPHLPLLLVHSFSTCHHGWSLPLLHPLRHSTYMVNRIYCVVSQYKSNTILQNQFNIFFLEILSYARKLGLALKIKKQPIYTYIYIAYEKCLFVSNHGGKLGFLLCGFFQFDC